MKNALIYTPDAMLKHEDGLERAAVHCAREMIDAAIGFIFDKDSQMCTLVMRPRVLLVRVAEILREAGWEVGLLREDFVPKSFEHKQTFILRVPGGNSESVQKPDPDYDFGTPAEEVPV